MKQQQQQRETEAEIRLLSIRKITFEEALEEMAQRGPSRVLAARE